MVEPNTINTLSYINRITLHTQFYLYIILYIISSIILLQHFIQVQYYMKQHNVHTTSPHRLQKIIISSIEQPLMVYVLLNLCIVVLCMCRLTLAYITNHKYFHSLAYYIPIQYTLTIHKLLSCITLTTVIMVATMFILHFGVLCMMYHRHTEGFYETTCGLLHGEIMITGYVLLALCTILLITSLPYMRRKYYDYFIVIHQCVVVLILLLTIIHSADDQARSGKQHRIQSAYFILFSVLLYITERILLFRLFAHHTRITSYRIYNNQVLQIQCHKPPLLNYDCGQFVWIKINEISYFDVRPYSIATLDRQNDTLTFLIQVNSRQSSWSYKLVQLLNESSNHLSHRSTTDIDVQLIGPFGTGQIILQQYNRIQLYASNSGITPLLPMFYSIVQHQWATQSITRHSDMLNNNTSNNKAIDESTSYIINKVQRILNTKLVSIICTIQLLCNYSLCLLLFSHSWLQYSIPSVNPTFNLTNSIVYYNIIHYVELCLLVPYTLISLSELISGIKQSNFNNQFKLCLNVCICMIMWVAWSITYWLIDINTQHYYTIIIASCNLYRTCVLFVNNKYIYNGLTNPAVQSQQSLQYIHLIWQCDTIDIMHSCMDQLMHLQNYIDQHHIQLNMNIFIYISEQPDKLTYDNLRQLKLRNITIHYNGQADISKHINVINDDVLSTVYNTHNNDGDITGIFVCSNQSMYVNIANKCAERIDKAKYNIHTIPLNNMEYV